jgi:hypothetical protein
MLAWRTNQNLEVDGTRQLKGLCNQLIGARGRGLERLYLLLPPSPNLIRLAGNGSGDVRFHRS